MKNNKKMSAVEKFQRDMTTGLGKYYKDAISLNVKQAFAKKRLSTCKNCNVNHCQV